GVQPARALPAQPAPGPDAIGHLRARLGLRLRFRVELARRLHRLPPPQDRGRRPAAPDSHGAGRRVRAPRGMSFRVRLTFVAAAAVAFAVVLASIVVYAVVRDQLRGELDDSLRDRAAAISRGHLEARPDFRGDFFLDIPGPPLGGAGGYIQVVQEDGTTIREDRDTAAIPVN